MREKWDALKETALKELEDIKDPSGLENWRVKYLGRRSELTAALRNLAALPAAERRTAGQFGNEVKMVLEEKLAAREEEFSASAPVKRAPGDAFDITLPGRAIPQGRLHPITQTIYEMCDIFISLGFQVVEGPEVEWEYYNFEALNIPKEHPARDNMSTFWVDLLKDGERPMLLRTHTSPMQVRFMEKNKPPIRIVVPGKVYRYEATNATHLPMFQQVEGLAVDENLSLADLKGALSEFVRRFFGPDRKARFRCDYFPFVEPGVELAVDCFVCHGEGCSLCKGTGWIEIGGAGMVHPDVLRHGGINPDEYRGFAFGLGIERIPMLRYGIEDIRHFYNNDLRFLTQF